MKKLNPDGSIIIPSNLPRTKQGPDSRGIRICFAELGRSCALKQGYLVFTDGSAYAYDTPSNSDVEALCDQLQRGKLFNFVYRRARGGFIRGFVPPADYQTIYSYPPYAGTQPIACADMKPDWTMTDWTVTTNSPSAGQAMVFTLDPGMGDTEEGTLTASGGNLNGSFNFQGNLSFTGGMTNCRMSFTISGAVGAFTVSCQFYCVQDGGILNSAFPVFTADGVFTLDFTVADTAGVASALEIDVQLIIPTSSAQPGMLLSTHVENL